MSAKRRSFYKLSLTVVLFWMVSFSAVWVYGQTGSQQPTGVPDDWTHHHVIFSDPGTAADALAHGRFVQWYRIVNDPRYIIQERRRRHKPPPPREKSPLHRDWSMNMGAISATQSGTVSSNPATGGTVTVKGQVLTASTPATATQTGTFSSVPTTASAPIVITNTTDGSNTLTVTTNATPATATGTFTNAPTASTSIAVTTSGGTLTLKTNATASTATGTFSGTGIPTAGNTATITTGIQTLTLTATATANHTGTVIVASAVVFTAGNNTLTVGGVVYTFQQSTPCGTTANCIYIPAGTNTTHTADDIEAAINANNGECNVSGCFGTNTVVNPYVTAIVGGTTVTLRNATTTAVTVSSTEGAHLTLAGSPITFTAFGCSNSTTGTFTIGSGPAGSASNLAAAINSCNTSFPVSGATASYTSGNSNFTVTDTVLGAGSFGGTISSAVFAWSSVVSGGAGSASCTGSSTPFTGTFATATTVAGLAQNIATAIGDCNAAFSATAAYTSGGQFKVSTTALDAAVGALTTSVSGGANIFTWAATVAGTAGTAGCTANTTATYVYNATLSTMATNLMTAINDCTASTTGVIAATSGASGVKLTANTTGSGGNTITLSPSTSGYFQWAGTALAGGSDGTTSGTGFAYWSVNAAVSNLQLATNISTAINENTTLQAISGVTATPSLSGANGIVTLVANSAGTSGNSITLSASLTGFGWTASPLSGGNQGGGTVGPGIYPAKYEFYSNVANCDADATPDFVIYNTGLAGSATQPSIVAYDNLYTGCSTTSVPVPNVYWQYYTGGTIKTNPILSADGTQVVFVQTNASSQAQLVMLKWAPGLAIQSLTSVGSGSAYQSCSAPCMYAITFATTTPFGGTASIPNDTHSSPFYDYGNDAVYVGEDNGWLHKFAPVFFGAPAEVATGFPVQVSSGPLSSPVYDFNSTLVFAGPATGANGASARMHSITTTGTPTVINSGSMAPVGTPNIMYADAPLVDPSAEMVYVFTNADVAGTSAAVWQLPYNFTTNQLGTEAAVGQGSAANPMYVGAFDNIYNSASGPVGNLYVCGRDASSQEPALWRIPINTTVGTPVEIGALTNAATNCSPITEFYNTSTSTDYIFLSVQASGNVGTCGGTGCIMSFAVTTPLVATTAPSATLPEAGGTSGIVIDNAVSSGTLGGASQIYFSPLGSQSCKGNSAYSTYSAGTAGIGTGGCAIQASQSGLN